jgi:hypothetical protein
MRRHIARAAVIATALALAACQSPTAPRPNADDGVTIGPHGAVVDSGVTIGPHVVAPDLGVTIGPH